MSNPAKRKGTYYEVRVRDYLRERVWPDAARLGQQGSLDAGDLVNTGDWCIEIKNRKGITLAQFMTELEREKVHAKKRFGACIINRKNHKLDKSYVVMTLADFVDLLNPDWGAP